MKKRVLFFAVVAMFAALGWAQTPELDKKIADLKSEEFSESIEWLNKLEKELKPHYSENDLLYAIVAHKRAELYASEYKYDKSVDERKKAIAILQKIGGNDENIAAIWRSVGQDYSNFGKSSEAIDAHKKSLEIFKRLFGENNDNTAAAYNNIAIEYAEMDKFDEAWKYYEKLISIIEKVAGPNSFDTAIVYLNVGNFFNGKGDYGKSLEYDEKSLAIVEKISPRHPFIANCYNAISVNYAALGEEDKSFAYSQKALKLSEKAYGEDNPEMGVFYNAYAIKLQEHARATSDAGLLIQAVSYYNKTIDLGVKYKIFDEHLVSTCYEFGSLFLEFGPEGWIKNMIISSNSQDEYDRVIAILIKASNDSVPLDLGKTIYPEYNGVKKVNDAARLYFNMALFIKQNVAGVKEDGFIANLYHGIGISYQRDGDSQEAKKYFKKALDIKKKFFGEFNLACEGLYFDTGYFAHQAGDNKTALVEWKKCLKSHECTQNYSLTIDRVKDILYYKIDDKAFTAQAINQALAAAEKARLDSDSKKSSIMRKILPVYYYAVKFSAEQNDAKKAFEYSEQMRSRAFLDQMGVEEALKLNGITDVQRNSVRELIGKIAGLKKDFDAQNSLPIADRDTQEMTRIAKELADAEKKLALLDAEITKKVPRYAQLRNPQTVTAAQAQAWCPQNRAVVEYVLWSDDYIGAGNENNSKDSYCIILAKNGAQIIKLDNGFDYSSCVNALRTKIINGKAEQDFEKERNDLYARLCEPLVAKLGKDVNELVIVPDGNLSFLPFDILRKNSFDKDFGENYSIELSPSISISYLLGKSSNVMGNALAFGGAWYDDSLSEAQHRQMFDNASASVKKNSRKIQATKISPDKMSANQREVIEELIAQKGIGGYLASKDGHWGNLPGTLTEVNRLQSNVFGPSSMTLKTQEQVTESSVKKLSDDGQLLRYPILHFACHGYFDKFVPEICSLVFSEVSGKFSKVSNDDGYLTVPEVSVLDLNADMVCLSACETGMGEIRSGDGLVGLSRGFMVAGAKNVGVSLWSVDDEATSEFMVRMYKKRKEGMSYVDAYRAVKNEFRKDSQWSHPFYWAAFTLYGGASNAGTAFAAQNSKNDKSGSEDAYQRALTAKYNGDYSSTFALCLEAASAGHVGAQGLLSQLYYEGKGANKDYAKAVEWANKAAKKNDPRGLNTLGLANYYGNGAKLDGKKGETYLIKASDLGLPEASNNLSYIYEDVGKRTLSVKSGEKALVLCKKAADAGLADAQIHLGRMYSSGYFVKKDMAKAAEYYAMAAEQGDAEAMLALGSAYRFGEGVPKDYKKAIELFEKAAEKNNGEALCYLGVMHINGEGVSTDTSKGIKYLERSASLGNERGQYNLGVVYEMGVSQGGGDDFYKYAANWYEKSANQGYPSAQHALARLYYDGKGVALDYAKSFELEKKAAESGGLPDAQYWLGYMYDCGKGIASDASTANKWYEKAIAGGNIQAAYELGYNYWNGRGIAKDDSKAFDLFNKVVANGQTSLKEYEKSLFYLGCSYNLGRGVKQDYFKAVEWYQKAAEKGDASAQCNLGYMYEYGQGVKQDYSKALDLYQKSALQGNSAAQYNLGIWYENGIGVKQDYSKAMDWYQKAAAQNHADAQNNIGALYEDGKGVAASTPEAKKWYQKSAANGNERAKRNLDRLNGVSTSSGSGSKWLFPLYGCELGKTTVAELAKKGKKDPKYKLYVINNQNFWCFSGKVFDSMYITKHTWVPEWKQKGYDPDLSYNRWMDLLKGQGYSIKVVEQPIVKDSSLSAKVVASKSSPVRHDITLVFNYSKKKSLSDSGTLYSFDVTLK